VRHSAETEQAKTEDLQVTGGGQPKKHSSSPEPKAKNDTKTATTEKKRWHAMYHSNINNRSDK
jgi:hypothetical protein